MAHSLGGMLGVRIARAYPDRIAHLVLTAPIGLEDYRLYVPPTPTEKILENEDKLTADGYRKQLETNYALKLPPEQVTPFIDARFNIKGSAEYPRWLRAFVSSAQMIYREPVAHEIPLITQPTLFVMGADDHNAPGRPNAPEALRSKMGQNAELAKALAAKMARGRTEVIPNTGHWSFWKRRENVTNWCSDSRPRPLSASGNIHVPFSSSRTKFRSVPPLRPKTGEKMKYLFAAVLALGTVASFSAAEAAGGCGPGWHRGPYGGCQPNRRAVVVRPAPGRGRPLQSSWCGPAVGALTAPCGATDAAALIDIFQQDKSPARAGLFLFQTIRCCAIPTSRTRVTVRLAR